MEKKIIAYEIVTANKAMTLQDAINLRIKNGWQPLGGVHAGEYGGGKEWAQALVLYTST
jgi:hypothetical protein